MRSSVPTPVFIVGSPRSGTTWLQRLLGAHPRVATSQELKLFEHYVAPWAETWASQLAHDDPEQWRRLRHQGLPAVLAGEDFERLVGDFVRGVYGAVLALKPGADVLVDKDPATTLHMDLVRRLLPRARFVHVVRDGRDVAVSVMRAGRGWGSYWAPVDARGAALVWERHVRAGREADLEVRYESLLARDPEPLRACLTLAGVEADDGVCGELYERTGESLVWGGEVVRRLGGPPPEPDGFFGEGRAGGWREAWSGRERASFAEAAGELLVELGYEPDGRWAEPRRREVALDSALAPLRRLRRLRAA